MTIILGALLAFTPRQAAVIADAHVLCDDVCHIQKSQDEIVSLMSSSRPVWVVPVTSLLDSYVNCGASAMKPKHDSLFKDFDETDRQFKLAFEKCETERIAYANDARDLVTRSTTKLSLNEVDQNVSHVRSLFFLARIAETFAKNGSFSDADAYGKSRFPKIAAFLRLKN